MNERKIKIRYCVDDEKCVKVTELCNSVGMTGHRTEIIITKEAFIECYNKWIKGEEECN